MTWRGLLPLFLAVGSCAAIGILGWLAMRPSPSGFLELPPAEAGPVPGHRDLPLVLSVLGKGGTHGQIEAAIEWLDNAARDGEPPGGADREALLAAFPLPAPAGLPDTARAHIFNSACNALGGAPDEALLLLLERIATGDPSHVMRLYALQHLGTRYEAAPPAWRERLRSLVRGLESGPAAGTALVLGRQWDPASRDDPAAVRQALGMAADPARPVDVRVTALHAAGGDASCLPAARSIAADASQPVILRKAAISLIGRHGGPEDIGLLGRCSSESGRLAQAGEPAARALRGRLAGPPAPAPAPF